MAFVRWRGNCAELLATVYDQGRSRQILLANLRGADAVSASQQALITHRFPTLAINWSAVNQALAVGPPGSAPLTPAQHDRWQVEDALRGWAQHPDLWPDERRALQAAAAALTAWRARSATPALTGPGIPSPDLPTARQ